MELNPKDIVLEALSTHKPEIIFCLFSGGNDSVCATHFTKHIIPTARVIHVDTGTGLKENWQHVKAISELYGWGVETIGPPEPKDSYKSIVIEHGFPGPAVHKRCYQRLKERQIRKLIRPHLRRGSKQRFLLITGIRQKESTRRMGYNDPIQRLGSWVWTAPLFYWDSANILDYMDSNSIPRNPVSDLIHRSGECNCGAFAKKGEKKEIAMWFPTWKTEIEELEREVEAAGHHWGWGENPKDRFTPNMFAPMCAGCSLRS